MKRSRNLTEIANSTRISRRYLEAIEADQVQELPGEFFYKAFIRQYAQALELDTDTTERIVGSAVPISEPDPVPVLHHIYERDTGESVRWRPTTAVAVGTLIAVIAGGSGLYALWQHLQNRPPEVAAQEAPPVPAPAPAPVQQEANPASALPQQPAAGTQASTPAPLNSAPTAAAAAAPGQIVLDLTVTEPVWVQISSDSTAVFTGTLEPGAPRQVTVGENAKLLTGNAGGLELRMNGKPVGPIGPRGQIRTVLFSGGTFQIAAPKPPPPDEDEPE
jgi:cytoskeleton protein RodZ